MDRLAPIFQGPAIPLIIFGMILACAVVGLWVSRASNQYKDKPRLTDPPQDEHEGI